MSAYQVGETIRLTAAITDSDSGAAVDPAIVKISINKPDGTAGVEDADMTKSATGSYYYDYSIPSNMGTYSWKVVATGSVGRITIVRNSFSAEVSI